MFMFTQTCEYTTWLLVVFDLLQHLHLSCRVEGVQKIDGCLFVTLNLHISNIRAIVRSYTRSMRGQNKQKLIICTPAICQTGNEQKILKIKTRISTVCWAAWDAWVAWEVAWVIFAVCADPPYKIDFKLKQTNTEGFKLFKMKLFKIKKSCNFQIYLTNSTISP